MPVILTPLHFDRDPLQKQPSCQRSVVIRTFITSDFMTGVPAVPGSEIPVEVRDTFAHCTGASWHRCQLSDLSVCQTLCDWLPCCGAILTAPPLLGDTPAASLGPSS